MNTPERPGREVGVWPPPPTSGPPTVAAPPPPQLRRDWVFWQITGRMTLLGIVLGVVCGALFGLVLDAGFGMMIGVIFGAIGGLILGVGDGLILAAVTCLFFFPLKDANRYRRTIGVLTTVVTLTGGLVLSGTVLGPTVNWLVITSTLIAAFAAWAASQIVARWYAAVSGQG